MADAAPAAASRGGSGSFWQRKEAGLPIWAWAALVGGGAAVIFIYIRMKSSSTSSTSTTIPTTTTGATSPAITGPGGFGYGGYGGAGTIPSGVNPGGPMIPASTTPSSPGNPSLPFQVQSGSGYWVGSPAQAQSTPITDAAGNEYEWLDAAEYQSLANSGIQVYYEVLPGVFIPVPAGLTGLAGGTPLYMQVPSGTATNPSAPPSPTPEVTGTPSVVPATGLGSGATTAQPVNGAPVYNGVAS